LQEVSLTLSSRRWVGLSVRDGEVEWKGGRCD
jgi:hypothetical protein